MATEIFSSKKGEKEAEEKNEETGDFVQTEPDKNEENSGNKTGKSFNSAGGTK